MTNDGFEQLYHDYLQSELDPRIGGQLTSALIQAGLKDEAGALRAYLDNGEGSPVPLQNSAWARQHCVVGAYPPDKAEYGDMWFDTIELMPMILIPNATGTSKDGIGWIAAHPVYVWQFRTFLRLVRWRQVDFMFLSANTDLMAPARFAAQSSLQLATEVNHQEAILYSSFFWKGLAGKFSLRGAREHLPREQFDLVLPEGMFLWDGIEAPQEGWREAASKTNMDDPDAYKKPSWKELDDLDEETLSRLYPNRLLYTEWERRDNVGFSEFVDGKHGLYTIKIPSTPWEFVQLQNTVFRPPKEVHVQTTAG